VSSAGPCPYSARLPRERLIRCLQYYFREWNPGAPIGVIDWEGLADSSLTLAENLERFEREYPVFRWRPEEPEERARREILEEVARSIEAALNAGYRPGDIARNLREALLKRGLTERQIQGILGALNLPEQPPAPAPQPPPQAPPAQPPPQPRPQRPSEKEIEAVLRRLEGRLRRRLRPIEYERFTVECAERAETLEDLEECADRLYEEFSKHPLQLPVARTKPQPPPQPQERARPPSPGPRQVTPEGITDRRGMTIPFAGRRRREPLQIPGYYPYMLAGCDREGKVFVYVFRTEDEMMDVLHELKKYGRKILYYGLEGTEEGEMWKSMEGQFSDECPREEEYGEGYA